MPESQQQPDFIPYQPQAGGSPDFIPYEEPKKAAAKPPDQPGFGNTLLREGKSLGQSIAGIPGGLYHAFTDPISPDERQEITKYEGEGGHIADSTLGLGVDRLAIRPVERASEFYYDAAKGNNPNAYDDALSVAPEAIGMGASAPVAAKGLEVAPRAAAGLGEAVRSGTPAAIRGFGRLANSTPGKWAARTAGAGAGHAVGGPVGAAIGVGAAESLARATGKLRNFGIERPLPEGDIELPEDMTPEEIFAPRSNPQTPVRPIPAMYDDDLTSQVQRGLELPRAIKQSPSDLPAAELINYTKRGPMRPAADIARERLQDRSLNQRRLSDSMEDRGLSESMNSDLENEGSRALRDELSQTQQAYPRAFRGPKMEYPPVRGNGDLDLTAQLEESLRHATNGKADTRFFEQAKKEMPDASISEQLKRAQELKDQVTQ